MDKDTSWGLSPRVRGNRQPAVHPVAGFTRVYPRVCGGTEAMDSSRALTQVTTGLSPRVRGNRDRDFQRVDESFYGLSPRVRGNHVNALNRPVQQENGLSPRVRGNRAVSHADIPCGEGGRSIPACAGEPTPRPTPAPSGCTRSIPACAGEPIVEGVILDQSLGSIPACAGEPRIAEFVCPQTFPWVYPRVCGGTVRGRGQLNGTTITVYPRVCGGTPC